MRIFLCWNSSLSLKNWRIVKKKVLLDFPSPAHRISQWNLWPTHLNLEDDGILGHKCNHHPHVRDPPFLHPLTSPLFWSALDISSGAESGCYIPSWNQPSFNLPFHQKRNIFKSGWLDACLTRLLKWDRCLLEDWGSDGRLVDPSTCLPARLPASAHHPTCPGP